MATERQIAANRANASKSTGPKRPAGKRKSPPNGISHGLLSQSIVLKGESTKRFRALLASLRELFQPRNAVEASLVETMAVSRWRQMRLWALERARLNHEACKPLAALSPEPQSQDVPTRVALALESITDNSRSIELMNRYEIRCDRQYSRALHNLLKLREKSDVFEQSPPSTG